VAFAKAGGENQNPFLHSLGERLAGEFNGNPEPAK